jgi:hypothetical protein
LKTYGLNAVNGMIESWLFVRYCNKQGICVPYSKHLGYPKTLR